MSGVHRIAVVIAGLLTGSLVYAQDAVKIDPSNPKYLLFRDKPLLLISASEHYGSVINRAFAMRVSCRCGQS